MKRGVNVFGYVYAESGVGQVTRLLVETLRNTGLRFSVFPFTETLSRQNTRFTGVGNGRPTFDINILGVNADQTPVFVRHFGRDLLESRYTIGIWAWEIEEFPEWMAESAAFLDEIWGISSFTAEAISKKVAVPVFTYSLPIKIPESTTVPRSELGLPEDFLFLYCFDHDSVFSRKNPLAAVEAFVKAFPEPDGTHLYIKSINGDRHRNNIEMIRSAVERRSDITYRDGYSETDEQISLMNACDAYVSLHRAEGFGLTMAEAMALGKPVIATGYSGNLDFMNAGNSFLVPFKHASIGKGSRPYPPDGRWAEPDVEVAAAMMRKIVENPDEARRVAGRARREVLELHSPAARSDFVVDRISNARRLLRK